MGLALVLAIATVSQNSVRVAGVAISGQTIFVTRGCGGCHTMNGVSRGTIGPNLTIVEEVAVERVKGLSAAEYVRQSIRQPGAFTVAGFGSGVMPTLPLTDPEVEAVVEFLLQSQ